MRWHDEVVRCPVPRWAWLACILAPLLTAPSPTFSTTGTQIFVDSALGDDLVPGGCGRFNSTAPCRSLATAVAQADNGDHVIVADGSRLNNTANSGIVVTQYKLTIRSASGDFAISNVVWDGLESNRGFVLTSGAHLILEGISFFNAGYQHSASPPVGHDGFVVEARDNATLWMSRCQIENCTSFDRGSVTLGQENELAGPHQVRDCLLRNNEATGDPQVIGGSVTVTHGRAWISRCRIADHVNTLNGPAVVGHNALLRIEHCSFDNNRATGTTVKGHTGGAIFLSFQAASLAPTNLSALIANCTFTNHPAGAIAVLILGMAPKSNASVTLSNCAFVNNTLTEDVRGGVFYLETSHDATDLTIQSSLFENNRVGQSNSPYSPRGAGVVSLSRNGAVSNIKIERCDFRNNFGLDGSALWVETSGGDNQFTALQDCVFELNTANRSGGAIHLVQDGWSMSSCVFRNNSALFGDGGAVFSRALEFEVEDTQFERNSAGGSGGALSLLKNGAATVAQSGFIGDCTMMDNSATVCGAALSVIGYSHPGLDLTGARFWGTPNVPAVCVKAESSIMLHNFASTSRTASAVQRLIGNGAPLYLNGTNIVHRLITTTVAAPIYVNANSVVEFRGVVPRNDPCLEVLGPPFGNTPALIAYGLAVFDRCGANMAGGSGGSPSLIGNFEFRGVIVLEEAWIQSASAQFTFTQQGGAPSVSITASPDGTTCVDSLQVSITTLAGILLEPMVTYTLLTCRNGTISRVSLVALPGHVENATLLITNEFIALQVFNVSELTSTGSTDTTGSSTSSTGSVGSTGVSSASTSSVVLSSAATLGFVPETGKDSSSATNAGSTITASALVAVLIALLLLLAVLLVLVWKRHHQREKKKSANEEDGKGIGRRPAFVPQRNQCYPSDEH